MSQFTMQQKIDAVAREIKMREIVYPSRVRDKKMKQEKADYEIAIMKDIAATLVGMQCASSPPVQQQAPLPELVMPGDE